MPRTIKVKCFRFNPTVDKEPHYQLYEVPLQAGMSVLNVLKYIYDNQDSSLAYYSCCHRGLCGRCTVTLNGKSGLSCLSLVEGNITIEPLAKRQVVKDLLVDL